MNEEDLNESVLYVWKSHVHKSGCPSILYRNQPFEVNRTNMYGDYHTRFLRVCVLCGYGSVSPFVELKPNNEITRLLCKMGISPLR